VELGFLTADLLEADGRLWAVKTGPDGFCLFYDQGSKACRIHPVKPLSCRSWPYYRTILENPGCFSEAKEICEALSDWNHSAFLIAFRALNLPLPPRSLKKASLEV
jgi:Fe-S-cluster containining protein